MLLITHAASRQSRADKITNQHHHHHYHHHQCSYWLASGKLQGKHSCAMHIRFQVLQEVDKTQNCPIFFIFAAHKRGLSRRAVAGRMSRSRTVSKLLKIRPYGRCYGMRTGDRTQTFNC